MTCFRTFHDDTDYCDEVASLLLATDELADWSDFQLAVLSRSHEEADSAAFLRSAGVF